MTEIQNRTFYTVGCFEHLDFEFWSLFRISGFGFRICLTFSKLQTKSLVLSVENLISLLHVDKPHQLQSTSYIGDLWGILS